MPIQLDLAYKKKDGTNITVATGFNSAPMQEAYRYVKFEKPATGDLLTWLEANAVRLPLTGTWVWNSGMLPSPSGTLSASGFTSNGNSYTSISFSSDGKSLLYDSTTVATLSSASNLMKYTNEAYRTITFTKPVQYAGNEDFVKWFTVNAKQLIVAKGTLIDMDLGNGEKTYRVLENYYKGGMVQCLAMYNASTSQKYNATSKTTTMGSITVQQYSGSDLDTYLNTTWYNTLSATAKAAIVSKSITQDAWSWSSSSASGSPTYSGTYGTFVPGTSTYSIGKYSSSSGSSLTVGYRNVYALGVQDVIDYLNDSSVQVDATAILRNVNIWRMFWNVKEKPVPTTYPLLRSAYQGSSTNAWCIFGLDGSLGNRGCTSGSAVRPAFTIDLSKIPYTISKVVDVPTITNTSFTYDGSVKSPTITGYDSSTMTISGTQSATNSGTYTITFTLAEGYMWNDFTTAPKKYSWKIGYVNSSFELETTSITGIPGQTKYLKILSLSPSEGSFNFYPMDGSTDVISAIAESAELIDGERAIAITFSTVGTQQWKISYSPSNMNYLAAAQLVDITCESAGSQTLSGTWIFNDTITPPENSFEVNVSFSCPDSGYGDTDMTLIGCNIEYDPPYMYFGDASNPAYNFSDNQWSFTNYQKIQFLSPFTGDTSFITWFMANATQQ